MSDRLYNAVKANAKKQAKELLPKKIRKAFKKVRQQTVGHLEKTLDTFLPGKSSLNQKQSLIETGTMPPKHKSKKGKGNKNAKRAAAAAGAKAGKKAAKRAVGNRRPKKTGNRKSKAFKGNRYGRPAGTKAKRGFSMDYACFKGRDYVTSLAMTGNNASTALEGPGQVIYKVQLQPWKMVSNGRLARCMALFEKWRPKKLSLKIRSSQPPGMNGGTVLMVYEPKVNENMPAVTLGQNLPDRAALSRYENHTNAKILQMNPNKTQRDGNTDFSVNVALQTGPYGGWFNYDQDGTSTLAESSSGQVMIMIQQPMNCRGSSGTYAATGAGGINWADLILDYEIECSVANDEPIADGPAGMTSAQGQIALSSSSNYQTQGLNSSTGIFPFILNYSGSDWGQPFDGFPQQSAVYGNNKCFFSFSAGALVFDIPQVSGYGLLGILIYKLAALSDAGTTAAGYRAPTCFTMAATGNISGTVVNSGVVNVASMGAFQVIIFKCKATTDLTPLVGNFYQLTPGVWTVGAGGSSTTTNTGATATWYFLEVPEEWQGFELPPLQQSILKLLQRSGEHVDEKEILQLFPKVDTKQPELKGDRNPLRRNTSNKDTKSADALTDGKDSDDDWDEPHTLHFDFSEARVRTQPPTPSSESDEKKAPIKTSRPSSLKSSGGKDKERTL